MRRIIVDYSKLTGDILNLLVEKFPEGYDDSHIIRFRNAQNELIEAVEVKTEDTIYLVKVSTKLASRMEKYDEEDIDEVTEVIEPDKDLDDDDIPTDDDDEDEDLLKDKGGSDEGDDDDDQDDYEQADTFIDDEEDEE